jgi:6-phosphofructokinase 1
MNIERTSLLPEPITEAFKTEIDSLAKRTVRSPLRYHRFVGDDDRALYSQNVQEVMSCIQANQPLVSFELAGPRENIFFDPANLKAAIVTCGGLCPGLNDVIRAIVHELTYMYGVKNIKGVQYGYAGLNPTLGFPLIDLTPETVKYIHEDGGTFLGSSRGPQPIDVIVDTLYREDIRLLFTIGGDGTLRGALAIYEEIKRRGLKIAVVGVPKTIDNDISLVARTFGFETAVGMALESLRCAHSEAEGAINGIGIVKLMGRHSGFVAAYAALASGDANFVLVPEVPFEFDGPNGFLAHLEKRIKERHHAVVVVAEGAGQNLFSEPLGADRSGNKKLGDIGLLVKKRVSGHFEKIGMEHSVKYIDPSYMIRSVPSTADDGVFCLFLGQQAVHAGMAGKTGLLVGIWNDVFTHIPIESAVRHRKQIEPKGILWMSVLESTGQPERMVNDASPTSND